MPGADSQKTRKCGLDPVVNSETEVLILGSLPSDGSRAKQQYYANRSNDFWKLLGAVLNEPLASADYPTRIEILLRHKIGLWAVFRSCIRPGSMDQNISKVEFNDFSVLKQIAPKLKLVCFNGKRAGQEELRLQAFGFKTQVLPSSSGADRSKQTERLRCWKEHLHP